MKLKKQYTHIQKYLMVLKSEIVDEQNMKYGIIWTQPHDQKTNQQT